MRGLYGCCIYGLYSHHSAGKSRVMSGGHELGTAEASESWSENDLDYVICDRTLVSRVLYVAHLRQQRTVMSKLSLSYVVASGFDPKVSANSTTVQYMDTTATCFSLWYSSAFLTLWNLKSFILLSI